MTTRMPAVRHSLTALRHACRAVGRQDRPGRGTRNAKSRGESGRIGPAEGRARDPEHAHARAPPFVDGVVTRARSGSQTTQLRDGFGGPLGGDE